MHLIAKDGYINISSMRVKEWTEAFPGIDIQAEVDKANAWLERNPSKRWKTVLGFRKWLEKAHDEQRRKDGNKHVTTPAIESNHHSLVYERNRAGQGQELDDAARERARIAIELPIRVLSERLRGEAGAYERPAKDPEPNQPPHFLG